jgi:hypothetical protein
MTTLSKLSLFIIHFHDRITAAVDKRVARLKDRLQMKHVQSPLLSFIARDWYHCRYSFGAVNFSIWFTVSKWAESTRVRSDLPNKVVVQKAHDSYSKASRTCQPNVSFLQLVVLMFFVFEIFHVRNQAKRLVALTEILLDISRCCSCWWGEAMSLNCCHLRAYCSSLGDIWVRRTMMEW